MLPRPPFQGNRRLADMGAPPSTARLCRFARRRTKARRESNAEGGIGVTQFYRKSIVGIPNIHKTTEHLFRLSPPTAFFRPCRGLFRGTFCNFVARNDSRRRLQHDMNAPNEIFPRKRSICRVSPMHMITKHTPI